MNDNERSAVSPPIDDDTDQAIKHDAIISSDKPIGDAVLDMSGKSGTDSGERHSGDQDQARSVRSSRDQTQSTVAETLDGTGIPLTTLEPSQGYAAPGAFRIPPSGSTSGASEDEASLFDGRQIRSSHVADAAAPTPEILVEADLVVEHEGLAARNPHPAVELVRATPIRRKRQLIALGILIAAIALITGLSVGLTVKSKTVPASFAPIELSNALLNKVFDTFPAATQESVSSTASTPQSRAWFWLVTPSVSHPALPGDDPVKRLRQRFALATFYFATRGENWTSQFGWLSSGHECLWSGCSCNGTGVAPGGSENDVEDEFDMFSIELTRNVVVGTLPPELGFLSSSLQRLILRDNSISGTFPSDVVGMLTKLSDLHFGENKLTGRIPQGLAELTNLAWLTLRNNDFTGTIPVEMTYVTSLRWLYMQGNRLSGTLPSRLGRLSGLRELALQENLFTGTIPPELSGLSQLEFLDASVNNLKGTLPLQLTNLTSLRYLKVGANQLTGTIPDALAQLTRLTTLQFGENKLTGRIPQGLAELTNLDWLTLRNNDFTGTIPVEMTYVTSLRWLYVQGNRLSGTLPSRLGQLLGLRELALQENLFTGTIPPELGGLSQLEFFDASKNNLNGTLPIQVTYLTNLRYLVVGANQLTGTIPAALAQLTRLTTLSIRINELRGTLPPELGRLTLLQLFYVDTNAAVSGSIPAEYGGGWRSIAKAFFYDTALAGSVPDSLCGAAGAAGGGDGAAKIWIDCSKLQCSCGCLCLEDATGDDVFSYVP
jgi:Leucine-rich repeat (LRR) protein